MSDLENHYNSPQAPIVPEENRIAGNLTETMLRYLKEASPWLHFIGVVGFISCGLTILGGIIILIASSFISNFFSEWADVPIWLLSLFYTAMGAVLFFPARFTYNFGSKIKKYQFSNSDEDLELAFKNNKSLWKFCGVLCITGLSMIPLSVFVPAIIGIIGLFRLY